MTGFYRDFKYKKDILRNGELALLVGENLIDLQKATNVSGQNSTAGNVTLTNVRLAWVSEQDERVNVSIPWIQIKAVRIENRSQGQLIVIETLESAGSFIIGYKIEDADPNAFCARLNAVWQSAL